MLVKSSMVVILYQLLCITKHTVNIGPIIQLQNAAFFFIVLVTRAWHNQFVLIDLNWNQPVQNILTCFYDYQVVLFPLLDYLSYSKPAVQSFF